MRTMHRHAVRWWTRRPKQVRGAMVDVPAMIEAEGTSAGVATVTGVGAAVFATVGSATAVATVTGEGQTLTNARPDDGIFTQPHMVMGTGRRYGSFARAAVTETEGTSAGGATVTGVAAAIFATVGSASGVATPAGVSATIAAGVGSSTGTATVAGVGVTVLPTSGAVTAGATVTGAGQQTTTTT